VRTGNIVYFISNGKEVKIGYSHSPTVRKSQLQTGNSNKLVLLGFIDGDKSVEKDIHKMFGYLRVRENGEWFSLGKDMELLDWINGVLVDKCIRWDGNDGKLCVLSKMRI